MKNKIIELVSNKILPDIEESMDDIFEIIASKKETQEHKDELISLRDLKKDFEELLEDAISDEMSEDEHKELMSELMEFVS